ncbi:MAG TPA: MFS transporter [Chitinophagaceae bacterium]|nr:MFS transporter [Chitinophagaceae bacterium]
MALSVQHIHDYFLQQKALYYRNYRLFMTGQTLSLIGTWIQRIAMIWLAYRLTNSAWLLGLVAFCEQVPIFIIAPFAGVFADRWNKLAALRRIEAFAMLQAFLLGLLTLLGLIQVWQIIVLSLCLGTINAFEVPVRQSFVVEMVNRDKSALTNAIALNSTVFNLSRLIGPTIAGVLIATAGEGWCFMINALSYGAVLLSLFMMRMHRGMIKRYSGEEQVLRQLKDGIRYIAGKPVMRDMLLMLALVSFVNAGTQTLAPVFAKDVLHGNASTLGWLMGAGGVGAIIGAIYLTRQRPESALLKIVSFTGYLLGAAMLGFAASPVLAISLLAISVTGFSQMLHTASTNTLLQLFTDDDKRGRVMSFYTMSLQGMMPFGSLLAGALAHFTSGPWAIAIMAAICLAGTFVLRQKKQVKMKPLLQEKTG